MTHAFWAIFVAILVAVMWFVDLGTVMWAIASVAVVLFAVAYIGLPIMMRRGALVTPEIPLPTLAPDDPAIPAAARAKLHEMDAALRALGFSPLDTIGRTARARIVLAGYHHPASAVGALVRVVMWPLPLPGQKGRVQSAALELSTRYRDDRLVELSNIGEPVPGIELVPGLVGQMPHVTDVRALSRYHALLVARFEAEHGLGAANREPLAPGATTLTMLREATKHAIAVQRAGGLIEPVPGATEVYRPTWRTAIRTGWARIPPVEEFVAQRVRARGERLARSLDGGAGALPLAERIGRRPGWALLVLGVAVATYAAATSLGAASVAFVGIYVARQIARRRGRTPGWRTVLGGGAAAAVPFGVIAALPILTVLDATAVPGFAMTAAVMVLPLVTLFSLGAAAAVEGFRAAAS